MCVSAYIDDVNKVFIFIGNRGHKDECVYPFIEKPIKITNALDCLNGWGIDMSELTIQISIPLF